MTIALQVGDAGTRGKEVHRDDDVDGSVYLLLSSSRRDMCFGVAPVLHHLQIVVQLMVVVIMTKLQSPQRFNIKDNIFPCHILALVLRLDHLTGHQIIEFLEIGFILGDEQVECHVFVYDSGILLIEIGECPVNEYRYAIELIE